MHRPRKIPALPQHQGPGMAQGQNYRVVGTVRPQVIGQQYLIVRKRTRDIAGSLPADGEGAMAVLDIGMICSEHA